MAVGLQIKTSNQLISGGYEGETYGVDGGYPDWTNVGQSGSVTAVYHYRDSDYAQDWNASRVECLIRDEWTSSVDPNTNNITITITTTIHSIARTAVWGSPNRNLGRHIRVWDYNQYNQRADIYQTNIAEIRQLSGSVYVSQRTFTLAPGQEASDGTAHVRNNVYGHDNDGTPSLYVDEYRFGISARNVLPNPPAAPTISLVSTVGMDTDCTKQNMTVRVTVPDVGNFSTLNTYLRYKLSTDANYSAWKLIGVNQASIDYVLEGLTTNKAYIIQVYSNGDGASSGITPLSVNTKGYPAGIHSLPTVTQTAEDDELTVRVDFTDATIATQSQTFTEKKLLYRYRYRKDNTTTPYLIDWTEIPLTPDTSGYARGSFTIRHLPANAYLMVDYQTKADGICQSGYNQSNIQIMRPPKPPVWGSPAQTNTGQCIKVVMPWTQPDASNFSTGTTYVSYSINNEAWTAWAPVSNWRNGSVTAVCVPYGQRVCFRAYSKGDGLRGDYSTSCVVVDDPRPDDSPYDGDYLINEILCSSLMYLTELICQEYWAIKDGDRLIYTNEMTKEQCHGDEDDPTLHSILSRIYRYFGALTCLVCSGLNDDFNYYKRANTGTVLQSDGSGDYGAWTTPDASPTSESTGTVTSGGVWDAIYDYVHSVFHYVGTWDYLTYNPTTLNAYTDVLEGQTALVKNGADGTNQTYIRTASGWTAGGLNDLDGFSLIHVNRDSTFTTSATGTVTIQAGSAWYWYNNNWNSLDADIEAPTAQLNAISEVMDRAVLTQNTNDQTKIYPTRERSAIAPTTTYGGLAGHKVMFITEPIPDQIETEINTVGGDNPNA